MVKAPKDPNAPKRPLSAYMLWAADVRDDVVASGDYSVTEVAKKLGKMWKKVSDKQKEKYISKANSLKAAYAKKKAKYEGSSNWKKHQKALADYKEKAKKKPFKKDPNAPKRPLSNYLIYVMDVRKSVVKAK